MTSKRHVRRKSCASKRRFADRQKAVDAWWAARKNLEDKGMEVYRCKFCRGFHFGHRKER